MISKEHFEELKTKYGEFASWTVWATEDQRPKSNIGDMTIFDLSVNQKLLEILNPNFVMVGLNFSQTIEKIKFMNFHDRTWRKHYHYRP